MLLFNPTQTCRTPAHISVLPLWLQVATAGIFPAQCQTAQYNMQPVSLGILPILWEACEDQQAIKPVLSATHETMHKTMPEQRGKEKKIIYAQSPDSTAHLLFHFFCNLISTGGSITTTTIDSRFWFRFLSFIVSLVGLLLWFPLKTKLFSLH